MLMFEIKLLFALIEKDEGLRDLSEQPPVSWSSHPKFDCTHADSARTQTAFAQAVAGEHSGHLPTESRLRFVKKTDTQALPPSKAAAFLVRRPRPQHPGYEDHRWPRWRR